MSDELILKSEPPRHPLDRLEAAQAAWQEAFQEAVVNARKTMEALDDARLKHRVAMDKLLDARKALFDRSTQIVEHLGGA